MSRLEGRKGKGATPASGVVAAGWPLLRAPEASASPPSPCVAVGSAGAGQTRWPVAGLKGLYTCETDQLARHSRGRPAGTTGRRPPLSVGRSGTQTVDCRRCHAGPRGCELAACPSLDRRRLGAPRHAAERQDRQTQALHPRANRNGPDSTPLTIRRCDRRQAWRGAHATFSLSALARKFGDVFGRRTLSLLAASRRPSRAETEGCLSSGATTSAVRARTLALAQAESGNSGGILMECEWIYERTGVGTV